MFNFLKSNKKTKTTKFYKTVHKLAYEAAMPSRYKRKRTFASLADSSGIAVKNLRDIARELEQNSDLSKGILDTLVNNVVGKGITVEPQLKLKNSKELDEQANDELLSLWEYWVQKPEVTGELSWNSCQRLICRSWFRDGEVLVRRLKGAVAGFTHNSEIMLSLQLLEADYLPVDYNDVLKNITSGVEVDDWGKPIYYYLYRKHPQSANYFAVYSNLLSISSNEIIHLKLMNRIGQLRGVSVFSSIIKRLEDIRDYEDSERIAARVAAALSLIIKPPLDPTTGLPIMGNMEGEDGTADFANYEDWLDFDLESGMVGILPSGAEMEIINSNRPNNNLENFRNSQLKAVAAGSSTGYSTISKDYNGTYSAQRQQLVEQSIVYKTLRNELIERVISIVYKDFINLARVQKPEIFRKTDLKTVYEADYIGDGLPWIDPQKEINAAVAAIDAGLKSRSQVIRENGYNPKDVFAQIERDSKRIMPNSAPSNVNAGEDWEG